MLDIKITVPVIVKLVCSQCGEPLHGEADYEPVSKVCTVQIEPHQCSEEIKK